MKDGKGKWKARDSEVKWTRAVVVWLKFSLCNKVSSLMCLVPEKLIFNPMIEFTNAMV